MKPTQTFAVRSLRRLEYYLRKLSTGDNFGKLIEDILASNTDVIATMVRRQLWEGINGDNKRITPEYRPNTVSIKHRKRQPIDRVTLKDTGRFYDSIYVMVGNNEIVVTAADFKTEALVNKYGRNIFKLTNENMALLRQALRSKLTKQIHDGITKQIRK